MAMALSVVQLIGSIAARIDGPRAWNEDLVIDLRLTDEARRYRLTLHNGALTQRSALDGSQVRTPAQLTLTLTKPQLLGVLAGAESAVRPGDPAPEGLRDRHPLTALGVHGTWLEDTRCRRLSR
ncbi:alkyl sulfatase C-terminal domain-containing protein [Streptomyces sp. NPDC002994]|uniref:alkyl sulfatase C-terminal domain-containing protein n=1 Tax=Streptomyces sp. NPDC002994 TaxID=3154441 RepID=UPI0033A925BB